MTPDEAAGPDEEFLDRLVAYDEALTAGGLPPPTDASLPPQLAERLQRAEACVRRLYNKEPGLHGRNVAEH